MSQQVLGALSQAKCKATQAGVIISKEDSNCGDSVNFFDSPRGGKVYAATAATVDQEALEKLRAST